MNTKECNYCHEQRPLDNFKTNLTSQCKICKKAYMRNYFLEHKDLFSNYAIKQKTKSYYKPMRKGINMKAKYGLNTEIYNKILIEQNECCAICNVHQSNFKKSLHIDHNHNTNKLRGLLCHNCNIALGLFQDSSELLLKASEYLKSHQENTLVNKIKELIPL